MKIQIWLQKGFGSFVEDLACLVFNLIGGWKGEGQEKKKEKNQMELIIICFPGMLGWTKINLIESKLRQKWFLFPPFHSIYIRTVSSYLFLCSGTFVSFLAGLGQILHVTLPKRPINYRMHTIISRGLQIFFPISLFSRSFFRKSCSYVLLILKSDL